MSNNALLEAIKTCSERPSKCFYFKETLSELGYHNIYSYEDRYSSLMDVTKKGYAVLVPEGLGVGGGGGGVSVKAEEGFIQKRGREVLGLVEAGGGFVQNTLAHIQSRAEGVVHGALQFTKDGDIRDAFETMNAVKEHRYEEYSHKLSDNAQSVVDNDPLIQTASSVINSTVGVALNTVDEVAKENLSGDTYFYMASTAAVASDLLPAGGKAKSTVKAASISKGEVQTRINIAKGPTRFSPSKDAGFQHVLNRHFDPMKNAGKFTISPDELKGILQSDSTIKVPVKIMKESGNYSRLVNVKKDIGIIKLSIPIVGGQNTSYIMIITDKAGNLVTAYPAPKP